MKTTELKKGFQDGKYEELLRDIYIDESVLDYQKERYIKAIESFEELFGEKEVEIYSAPGRSEIGGNHTDHQLGRVLAASINLDAIAIVAKKENGVVLKSEGYPMINVSLADLLPKKEEEGTSEGLIRGVAAKLKEEGYEIGGFEAYVTSDVLNGAGMSSSAAFEVLTGNILSGLYNEGKVSPVLIAQAGQYAENVFFGKPCGLMDQMASSVGNLIFIDFADVKNPVIKKVNVNFEDFDHSLCIIDTKGSHADLTDEYAAIPEEMKKVAAYFGKEVLHQIDKNEFYIHILGETLAYKVFHVETVKPEETGHLAIARGRDRITLVTCTPYGINTHHLLVHAKRVPYKEKENTNSQKDTLWKWLMKQKVFLISTDVLVFFIIYFLIRCFWQRNVKKRRRKKNIT